MSATLPLGQLQINNINMEVKDGKLSPRAASSAASSHCNLPDEVFEETSTLFDKIKKTRATKSKKYMRKCFEAFDKDSDGVISSKEFSVLLKSLFSNHGKSYKLSEKQEQDLFKLLDENQDGNIDAKEFEICWYHWLHQILDPVSALVVVDVQNDFISGSLAIVDCPAGQSGEEVVPVINHLVDTIKFDLIVYSSDWHPPNHISFIENVHSRRLHPTSKVTADEAATRETVVFAGPPIVEQKLWPAHCVQETWGAQLHPELKIVEPAIWIKKGSNPEVDSYSAFWDNKKMSQTSLVSELTKLGVTDAYVVGIAYDVCVGATASHAVEHGFRTVVVDDACRGVDEEDICATKEKLTKQGAIIVNSNQVKAMVECDDRRYELGYHAALSVAMGRRLVHEGSK